MFFSIILVIHQTSKLVAIWISIDLGFDKSWLLTAHLPFWSWGEARQNAANDELCSLSLSHHKPGILKTPSHISLTQMDWMIGWIQDESVWPESFSTFPDSLKVCWTGENAALQIEVQRLAAADVESEVMWDVQQVVERGTETFSKSANVWHEKKQ